MWQLAKRRQGTHKTKGRSEVRGSTRKVYAQKKTGRARHGTIRAPIFRHGTVRRRRRARARARSLDSIFVAAFRAHPELRLFQCPLPVFARRVPSPFRSLRAGGIAHGPVVRSHAFKLPKKVRALGLKVALSAKAAEPGALWIVPASTLPSERKTSVVAKLVRQHGWGKGRTVVFVGPNDRDLPFLLASRSVARCTSAPRLVFVVGSLTLGVGVDSHRNLRDFDVLRAPGLNVYDIVRARRVILTTDAVRYVAARFGTTVVEAAPAATQAEAQAETATG